MLWKYTASRTWLVRDMGVYRVLVLCEYLAIMGFFTYLFGSLMVCVITRACNIEVT